ncbi:hypothetical protein LCGC14_1022080 [marine sediment metagenome]|uniref:Uncharacterized protein n=1 Tax=marine sediment metagenome TaxID=412755 RepID=A0A0F9QF83_9ZZZZ
MAFIGVALGLAEQWFGEADQAQFIEDEKEWGRDVADRLDERLINAIKRFDDPDNPANREGAILDELWNEMPDQAKADYAEIIGGAEANRATFDAEMAKIDAGHLERIASVMGLIEGQGDQAIIDIAKTFGQAKGKALTDLTAQGLSGSGVGASIGAGFAVGESDALARSREETALIKSQALSGLTGEHLAFGAKAAELGAGFDQNISNLEFGALQNVYNLRLGGGQAYADWLGGRGDRLEDIYSDDFYGRMDWLRETRPEAPLPNQGFAHAAEAALIGIEGGAPGFSQ